MTINIFKLEDYLSQYEFTTPYLLCCSDAETWSIQEILAMADTTSQQLWHNLRLGYTEAQGLPLLKETIAHSIYKGLNQNQILCFAGAEDGIFCSLFGMLQEEDHVIVLTPCYQSLLEIPKLKKCSITMLPLKEENDWRIDINKIQKAIQSNTKMVIMNFPHNPTGQIISQTEIEDLISLLDRYGIWLFSDEVYRLLGPKETLWAEPAACLYPRALSLGVMSKAFGMAGLRIGWIACQDSKILKEIEYVKHYTSICNSGPSEVISLIALQNKEKILKRNNEILNHNLNLLDIFFEKYKTKFSWVRPQGGCVGFANFKETEPIDQFSQRLAKEKGVLLMPSQIYDYPTNHFRIGFGRKNMLEALEKFEDFIK